MVRRRKGDREDLLTIGFREHAGEGMILAKLARPGGWRCQGGQHVYKGTVEEPLPFPEPHCGAASRSGRVHSFQVVSRDLAGTLRVLDDLASDGVGEQHRSRLVSSDPPVAVGEELGESIGI